MDSIINFYLQHTILFWIIAIEIFPVLMMLREIIVLVAHKTVDTCVQNKQKENRVASILYFFKDLGPNTASFSIVTLIVDMPKEDGLKPTTVVILTIIFFVGIMLKEKSREYIHIFYKMLEIKRSSKWEQSSE